MRLQSINPATEALLASYDVDGPERLIQKVEQAQIAQIDWRKKAVAARAKYIRNAADVLRLQKETLAQLITAEMGKPITQSRAEIEKCALLCHYYADHAKQMLKDESVAAPTSHNSVLFEPLGLVLAVMPWNFPFWQVFRFAVPALLAGNGALLKHASNVTGCSLAIADVWQAAGLPDHLFQSLVIGADKVKQVIALPQVSAVTLTGSEVAGSEVAAQAGKLLKKTVLELGGSDPFIVLKEANLKAAARVAVQSRMINNGQSCIAAKRIIVEKSVAQSFIALLAAEMQALQVGNPTGDGTDIGPLARKEFVHDIQKLVDGSLQLGATIAANAKVKARKGYYFQPLLITGVTSEMPLFTQESFGPVLPVIIADDVAHAIDLANETRYGLGAAVWTENTELAQRLVRQIQAGTVVVNGMVVSDPKMPFGGIKQSGYGRELSRYGLMEFVNIKSVVFHS